VRGGAGPVLEVPVDVVGERVQGRGGETGGTVGVTAGATVRQEGRSTAQPVEENGVRSAGGQGGEVRGDGGQSEVAGAALAGAVGGQVAQDPSGFGQPAGGVRERYEHARARRGTQRSQAAPGEGRVQMGRP
jgi:hypothetical protein